VRQKTLRTYPRVRAALGELRGLISVDEMRQLNFQVDGEHRSVKEVVHQFLLKKGILKAD
jgi:glycine betaine/choline ABC-type transport system substrate-binding protein